MDSEKTDAQSHRFSEVKERMFRDAASFDPFTPESVMSKIDKLAKFPHSTILHYACGSMKVVLCLHQETTKTAHSPTAVALFLPYFPLTMTCIHNVVKYEALRKFSGQIFKNYKLGKTIRSSFLILT